MLGKFFRLFNKQEAEQVTKDAREVIEKVSEDIKAVPVEVKKRKPRKKCKHVMFRCGVKKDTCIGAVIDTRTIEKENTEHPTINIVVIYMRNGRTLSRPELKWINDRYCSEVDEQSAGINVQYFDVELWDVLACSLK